MYIILLGLQRRGSHDGLHKSIHDLRFMTRARVLKHNKQQKKHKIVLNKQN